jgi:hypothetical protein
MSRWKVVVKDLSGRKLGHVSRREAESMVANGAAAFIQPGSPRQGVVVDRGSPVKARSGQTIKQLAAEKFPLVVQGGLTRTETQPAVKPYPVRWPETTTLPSRSTRHQAATPSSGV